MANDSKVVVINKVADTAASTGKRAFPVLGIAFLIMLVMKLGNIGTAGALSWWWVTAPLWAFPALAIGIVATALTVFLLFCIVAGLFIGACALIERARS